MTGLFRLLHGDRLVLTEHMAIDTLDGRPTMRVRHFSPDFVAWEEKSESVAFPLIRAEQGAIYLDGLTIRASGPDGLVFHLLMTDGEGVSREEIIRYRRVR